MFASAAIFAAAGLVGCGAENGQGESGAIGSTSEAITVTNASPVTTLPNADKRFGASSCVVHDSNVNKDYLIVAGGFDNSATPAGLSSVLVYDAAAPQAGKDHWSNVSVTGSLGIARGFAAAIQDPSDSSKCYVIGGEPTLGGVAVPFTLNSSWNVDTVTVTGTRAVTVAKVNTAAANLPTARSQLQLSTCGTKIMAVGGRTTGTTATGVIEMLSGGSWSTPTGINVGSTVALPTAVYNFALAKEESSDNFVVSGGDGSGAVKRNIQVITSGTSCTKVDTKDFGTTVNKRLSSVRRELVGFPKLGTANTFLSFAGFDTVAASNAVDEINVTSWTAGAQTLANVSSSTNGTATIAPMLVFVNAATPSYQVLGGESVDATTTTKTGVAQQFISSAWDTVQDLVGDSNGVVYSAAAYLPSAGKTYLVTGASLSTGTRTLLTTGDEIGQ
jgi:hypothetical protein